MCDEFSIFVTRDFCFFAVVFGQFGGVPGDLTVPPNSVHLGESFSLFAPACPGPPPIVGAYYSIAFTVSYLPPPGASSSYSDIFTGSLAAGTEDYAAS